MGGEDAKREGDYENDHNFVPYLEGCASTILDLLAETSNRFRTEKAYLECISLLFIHSIETISYFWTCEISVQTCTIMPDFRPHNLNPKFHPCLLPVILICFRIFSYSWQREKQPHSPETYVKGHFGGWKCVVKHTGFSAKGFLHPFPSPMIMLATLNMSPVLVELWLCHCSLARTILVQVVTNPSTFGT